MIQASLRRKVMIEELENILTVHESHKYNNDQEYMVALELPLGLHEYFWGDKNFNAKSEAIQSRIEEIVSKNKDVMRLSDYFTRLQKELRKEEKVIPLGRSGRTMTFGSSDSATLGAIRIMQVLVKLGFVTRNTFARWLSYCGKNLFYLSLSMSLFRFSIYQQGFFKTSSPVVLFQWFGRNSKSIA